MKKSSILNFVRGIVLASALCVGASALAQTNATPPAFKKAAAETKSKAGVKPRPIPFHGNLGVVDKAGKTITVGKRTFQVTSETKIYKGGKPAVLEDGVAGDFVTGSYRKTEDGTLNAASIYLGGRNVSTNSPAKLKKTDKPAKPATPPPALPPTAQ